MLVQIHALILVTHGLILVTHFASQAYGRIDHMDPTCQHTCMDSPFVILQHLINGSLTMEPYDGVWHSHIIIKYPGRYAMRLEVDGVTSPIIVFEARSKAARIEILRQPKARDDGKASNPGDLFEVQPGKSNDIHVKFLQWDAVKCNIALARLFRSTLIRLACAMILVISVFKCVIGMMSASLLHAQC